MPGSKAVYLTEEQFETMPYSQPGAEKVVATAKVPSTQVWQVPAGMPLVAALVAKQTHTIASGTTKTIQLDPLAPITDFMGDPLTGEYGPESYLTGYVDMGGAVGDVLVGETTGVQYTGTFETDGDFVTAVELENTTSSEKALSLFTVARHGYTKLQKRNSGKGNVAQELQNEDAITWAFSNPDDPETDRQVTWDVRNEGMRGVIPPKFNFDLVYYDHTHSVHVDAENADAWSLSIPVNQRPLKDDEDPADLRRKVTQNMV